MIDKKREASIKNALASQRIEGLEPDSKVIEDAKKWANGEITIHDAIEALKKRLIQKSI